MIERRLQLLTRSTGHSQSFFVKQLIEQNIAAMEAAWLPDKLVDQIRAGQLPEQLHGTTPDLFEDPFLLDLLGDPVPREDPKTGRETEMVRRRTAS